MRGTDRALLVSYVTGLSFENDAPDAIEARVVNPLARSRSKASSGAGKAS